ncbi:hypothetical protein FB545_0609 [Peribacillus frigoritolerans]|nr:hypothetical protein FB545_0609 [Peribacillus frigoritolerans]
MRRFKGLILASSNQNEREVNVHIKLKKSSLISEIRSLSADCLPRPTGFLVRTADSRGLDTQSNAFFNTSGIPESYSGLTINTSTSWMADLNDTNQPYLSIFEQ